jgi:hypothetical protein
MFSGTLAAGCICVSFKVLVYGSTKELLCENCAERKYVKERNLRKQRGDVREWLFKKVRGKQNTPVFNNNRTFTGK